MRRPDPVWTWVRHAPTATAGFFCGQLNVAADTGDGGTLRILASSLPNDTDVIMTPLRRTRDTFDALLASGWRPSGRCSIDPDFMEQDFGSWEGRSYDELAANDPAYWPFWDDPARLRPPGGESFVELQARVARALSTRIESDDTASVTCIAHAGVIRAVLALALDLTPDVALGQAVAPLSLHRVRYCRSEGRWYAAPP